MARDISVSIAVQGEKEFSQALKSAQSAVKVLASELKLSEASFDENADAQQQFATRTKLINAQIDQQKAILASLQQAVRESAAEFGDASTKTDKYRIELNRTQASIAKLEKSLRETQQEAEELGRDSTRVGRQIENGIGDAAEDASDKLDEMVGKIGQDLDDISSAVRISAIKDVGEAIFGAFEAVDGFVTGTMDYRRQLAFLEQNAIDAGFDFDFVKNLMLDVSSITGDTEGAIEGISNLLATGFDSREMTEAIDLLGGAVIRFPETFKFEELASSLRESVKSGNATGQYAELLEALGVDLEMVNKAFADATTEEEGFQVALSMLNGHGLEDTTEGFGDLGNGIQKATRAQKELEDAMAGLGAALQPAQTAWTNFKTEFVLGATDMVTAINAWYEETKKNLEEGQSFWEATGFNKLPGEIWEGYKEQIEAELGPYLILFDYAKEQMSELTKDLNPREVLKTEEFGELIPEEWVTGLAERVAGMEEAARAINDLDDTLGNPLQRYKNWVEKIFGGGESTEQDAQNVVDDVSTQLESAAEGKNVSFWEKFLGVSTAVAEEADTAVTDLTTEIEDAAEGEKENMETIGNNFVSQIARGVSDNAGDAISAAQMLWQSINDVLSREIYIPAPKMKGGSGYDASGTLKGGGKGTGGSTHIELVAQIEKRTVAREVADDVSSQLGATTEWYDIYG